MLISALKVTFLFLGVWFTIININRAVYKSKLSGKNLFIQAVGIVGFVVMQFNLYE